MHTGYLWHIYMDAVFCKIDCSYINRIYILAWEVEIDIIKVQGAIKIMW